MARALIIVALCGALAVAGCGGDDADSSELSTVASFALKPKPEIPQGPPVDDLVVKDLIKGTGAPAEDGDLMVIHYVAGIYETGEEIESAWVKGSPFGVELGIGKVIPEWSEGLPGMRVGGRRALIFPTSRETAPPGSELGDTLVYVIDLVRLNKGYVDRVYG